MRRHTPASGGAQRSRTDVPALLAAVLLFTAVLVFVGSCGGNDPTFPYPDSSLRLLTERCQEHCLKGPLTYCVGVLHRRSQVAGAFAAQGRDFERTFIDDEWSRPEPDVTIDHLRNARRRRGTLCRSSGSACGVR